MGHKAPYPYIFPDDRHLLCLPVPRVHVRTCFFQGVRVFLLNTSAHGQAFGRARKKERTQHPLK